MSIYTKINANAIFIRWRTKGDPQNQVKKKKK